MKSIFSFYLRYILFLLGVQMLFNILFLVVYHNLAEGVGYWDRFLSLIYGLKHDVSLAAYIIGFPTLVLILFSILRAGILRKIIGVYTILILVGLLMGYVGNLVLYKYWRFPIDKSVFNYLSTPSEMMASISLLSNIILIGIIGLLIYVFYFRVYLKWVSKPLDSFGKRNWIAAALFLLILPSLMLPIRGGLGSSPLQVGSVYFHENGFINHAAINPIWNLIYTLIEGDKMNPTASFYPDDAVENIMQELYQDEQGERLPLLNTKSPNVILVLLESFGQLVVTEMDGEGKAAPNFNALVHEGIFFRRFFCAGTMTDRALGAVLGGYPSLPRTSVIYYERKAQKLPNLNLEMKSAGYNSAFLYGGDIDFAHIRSFIVAGGFEKIISDKDFSRAIPESNWGIADEYLFEKLLEMTDQASSPFFHVLLTLSSHTPFDVPMDPVFKGTSHRDKYFNSIYYTDKCLGEFIREAKTRDWWDETLIIFMGDHGFRVSDIPAHDKRRFNIPMLWTGGAIARKDTIITTYGSQTDFPLTLLNQMDLSGDDFRFSRDMLLKDSRGFAFYAYNEGIGFINDTSWSVYSLVTGDYILKEGSDNIPGSKNPGLAYLQSLYRDFNSK